MIAMIQIQGLTPERIRALRKAAGFTQQQVADAIEVCREEMSRWETGVQRIRVDNALALIALLDPDITGDYSVELSGVPEGDICHEIFASLMA